MKFPLFLNILIPIGIKFFVPDGRYGSLTIIVDTIVLPVLLIGLNAFLLLNKIELSVLRCFVLMLGGLLLGYLTGYLIWGVSHTALLNPDAETIWINRKLIFYHIFLTVILYSVIQVLRFMFQAVHHKT